ncbi:MAG: hypothetical protein F4139_11295 [Gemmatimonadetes bacterium]|nr:hypothetical protein [Gemmatimonadota bacterium]MYI45645.1 hypothetical protein [Gemmatimonadota bacterium]MYK67804.1 hypothetical protein [Gemmatimonadota bacterium]
MHAVMDRSGYSLIEIAMVLVILVALAPPLIGSAAGLRRSFMLSRAQEEAARLFAEARWAAVGEGGAIVILNAVPPWGAVVTVAGDTTRLTELGAGGVSLRLSGGRPNARVRFGPLGLGLVSSQTLTFELDDEERRLVVSSLGRVSRR